MSIQMAVSAGPAPRVQSSDDLGWLLLIPLGCLVLGQVVLAWSGVLGVLEGGLADPDSYMRLNRVLYLHESGQWFDPTYPRIDPPHGHVQHWTRPLDALLLAGAWLLEPFLGFRTGLHVWGVLFSPVCLALTVLALNWASAPVLPRDARMIACLLLLLQPTVIAYSSLGRADHHALLFLLFVLLLGATARLLLEPEPGRMPLAAGAVMALAVWISPEALVFIAASLTALSLYWLFGDRLLAERCRSLLGWTTAFLILALLIERGPVDLLAPENDRLSIVHVTLFASIALFWAMVTTIEAKYGLELRHRLPLAAGGLAVVTGVMLALFPALLQGPLGTVDPLYRTTRLEHIVEIQPLIWPGWLAAGAYGAIAGHVLPRVGIALFALPFLILRLVRSSSMQRRFWVVIGIGLLTFLPLAFHQVRWSSYVQILLVLPYGALIHRCLGNVPDELPLLWRSAARAAVICTAFFWPIFAAAAAPKPEIATAMDACSIAGIAPTLNRLAGGEPKTILALADFGSELLYRTPHSVLSIPNHRPQPGYTATHRILTATDPDAARRVLARHGVDWILLCPGAAATLQDAGTPLNPALYTQLIEGTAPAWLHRLQLDAASPGTALLYEVEPARSVGPSTEKAR